ncbi:MAG: hypothetical protein DMF97_22060, partial [Acidobacteria bacterium]
MDAVRRVDRSPPEADQVPRRLEPAPERRTAKVHERVAASPGYRRGRRAARQHPQETRVIPGLADLDVALNLDDDVRFSEREADVVARGFEDRHRV